MFNCQRESLKFHLNALKSTSTWLPGSSKFTWSQILRVLSLVPKYSVISFCYPILTNSSLIIFEVFSPSVGQLRPFLQSLGDVYGVSNQNGSLTCILLNLQATDDPQTPLWYYTYPSFWLLPHRRLWTHLSQEWILRPFSRLTSAPPAQAS